MARIMASPSSLLRIWAYTKPATVVMGDIDGDTADELVAGAGRARATIR